MSNTKHTPAPWRVKHSESKSAFNVIGTVLGGKYKIARCPYLVLEDMTESSASINEREKNEAEANARLIASAPSLLEALKEVAGLWEEELPLDLTTYNKVKNAIKQAEQ